MALWVVLLAATYEILILGWVQNQNYLSFLPIQGDIGDYNQALYTTTHSQGFFYYTVNIPGGSNGSIWAAHFAPILILLLPVYSLAPSPMMLIFLKQAALALAAVPLFGIAKTYYRGNGVPLLFASFWLISPFVTSTDWNNFDLEPFFPVMLLFSLYYFSRGRFWPFIAFWILALCSIEDVAPIVAFFAVGGILGSYLAPSASPYWSHSQQRRPLYAALATSLVWVAMAYAALSAVGARPGSFGNAYSIRYSVLGATSLPDVPLQAVTHPGLALAALQTHGSAKALFLVLIVLLPGVLWLLGGLRYLLPIGGYLFFALLSNNPAPYLFGTEEPVILAPFLFVGTLEGSLVVLDWFKGSNAMTRRAEVRGSLVRDLHNLIARLKGRSDLVEFQAELSDLKKVGRLVTRDDLGGARAKFDEVTRRLKAHPQDAAKSSTGPLDMPSDGRESPDRTNRLPLVRRMFRRARMDPWTYGVFVALGVLVIPTSIAGAPLFSGPVGGSPHVSWGLNEPNAHAQLLETTLQLIPSRASVLTIPHLFPELSNRPNAYVVPTEGFLPTNETLQQDLDNWANISQFIAIDLVVDPLDAEILEIDTNLSQFGLYASNDGALILEKHWVAPPVEWTPWTWSLAGGRLIARSAEQSNLYSSSLGPSLYHGPGGTLGGVIWGGPSAVNLPLGHYSVTFNLELKAASSGAQVGLEVASYPAMVNDTIVLTVGQYQFHEPVVRHSTMAELLGASKVTTASADNSFISVSKTIDFSLNRTGFVDFVGDELSTTMAVYLVSVQVDQLSGLP